MATNDWDDYRVFSTVLRLGGFKLAAESLGVSHGTARAAVNRLEHRLGAALFVRAPEGLTATTAGLALGVTAERMAATVGAFDRMLGGDVTMIEGRVRIAVNRENLLAIDMIIPAFVEIRRQCPGLNLTLGLGVDWEDMLAGAADVAVRVVAPDHADLVGQEARGLRLGLFAHRSLLARFGVPVTIEDLRRFPMVAPLNPIFRRQVLGLFGLDDESPPAVGCDNRGGQLAAVAAGLGVANCPLAVAARRPELCRILPDLTVTEPLWVVLHRAVADVPRFAVVRDLLVEHLNALED